MPVPLKGQQVGYNDAYNFYLSHLRIMIERAFGALVHRWFILRAPLTMPIPKVTATIMCLCCLHNFCINCNKTIIDEMTEKEARQIQRTVEFSNRYFGGSIMNSAVTLDKNGIPQDLLHGGHHLRNTPRRSNKTEHCPHADIQNE